MGLDTVELVLDIEKVFNVAFSNDDAANILTAGNIHGLILSKRRIEPGTPEAEAIWLQLQGIIAEQAAVEVAEVTLDAQITRDLGLN